jgi:hypothetical protein
MTKRLFFLCSALRSVNEAAGGEAPTGALVVKEGAVTGKDVSAVTAVRVSSSIMKFDFGFRA